MARKNRVSVYDGVYHVTTRIANRAMLLKPDEVKERLMKWIVSVANFSGVEVWGFTVMDNHLHLIVHVPPVPKEYWLDANEEPAAYAFGMRPPECRVPLWNGDSPSLGSLRIGDSPSPGSVASSAAVGPKETWTSGEGDSPRRPPVGFMLDDAEMLARLRYLYSGKQVDDIAEEWARMRRNGLGNLVDERKRRYCRRMYNLSQYLKTLKEKVSMWYNDTYGHEGCLWQGRFYSGVVERKREVLAVVAAYVAYNPVKAGIAPSPDAWKWSSYSLAANDAGENGERCRRMYEAMFGQPWEEVRAMLESIYADELPPGVTPEELKRWFDDYDEETADKEGRPARVPPTYRASQAIRVSMKVFKTGAYISADFGFLKKVRDFLPRHFPKAGRRSVKRCRAFIWELPRRQAA